jgi:Membrane domain of glycerophosphoryl diester phosphodiesterase.
MGIMNLAEIMDEAIEILKKYMKTIVLYDIGYGVLAFIGAFALIIVSSIIAAILIIPAAVMHISTNSTATFIFTVVMIFLLLMLIAALVLSMNVGIIKITSQRFMEDKVYASTAIGLVFKNIIKVLGFSFISIIFFIPVIVGYSFLVYLFYKFVKANNFEQSFFSANAPLLIVSFVVLMLIAYIIFFIYKTVFAFALHVMILEKKGVIKAIKRSLFLTKKEFWRLLGVIILFSLTVIAITYSFEALMSIIGTVVYFIMKLLNTDVNFTTYIMGTASLLRWPVSILSWVIISPISTIMLTVAYFNQRFKKEGFDLLLRLKEMEKINERNKASDAV